ncbi:UNVERIFIED_CONTAM: hypothetical protein RMT77_007002 [Armadillidium vulgare]
MYLQSIFPIFVCLLNNVCFGVSNNSNKDAMKVVKLPPCAACKILVNSFNQGMIRTARGKFEGGDAAWEEEKMKIYKNSEVRLVEIQEKLCSEVERGQAQCLAQNEEHENLIEDWWFHFQESHPNLHGWLCIDKLKVCCPANHFGADCLPCKGGTENPCSGNGKCKGSGTRKGNGECDCNTGYEGSLCNKCSSGFFEAYRDENKILCEPCHKSCDVYCTQAGPKSCTKCRNGWFMDTDIGCVDVNECLADSSVCDFNEFCVNNEGSYMCIKCSKACRGCSGDGPDMCDECAEGFILEKDTCVDKSGRVREEQLAFARYITYAGLAIATCIILQRHTVMAAVVGLCVAIYISFSEYYLTYMQNEQSQGSSQVPLDIMSDPLLHQK